MVIDTAATVISRAARQLGLVSADITNPYASTDPNVLQLCALLDEAGRELVRAYDWEYRTFSATATTANGTADYALATDFDRLVEGSVWDETQDLPGFPISEQQRRQMLITGVTAAAGGIFYCIKNNRLHIVPTPTSIRDVSYTYIGTYTVTTAAADLVNFDSVLIVTLLKLKFMQIKGFPTDPIQRDYDRILAEAKGADGTAAPLNLGGPRRARNFDPRPLDNGYGS